MRFSIRALAVSCLLVAATSPSGAADVHPLTGEPLADDQTFAYQVSDPVGTLDPHRVDSVIQLDIVRDLFEGLFNEDQAGDLTPGVATGYESNPDKTVFTFHLRPAARWSDGAPVVAQDFVYAWRRIADPATQSPYAWFIELTLLENMGAVRAGEKPPEALGVVAVDDHTLEMRLSASLAYFPVLTTHPATFPVPRAAIEAHGEGWTSPETIVSNGAYTLVESGPERIVRTRNRNYWDDGHTIIDTVIAHVADTSKAVELFNARQLDRFDIPSGEYPALHARFPELAISIPRMCVYYYTFNLAESGPAALKDVNVRRALSLAVDRDALIETELQGGQTPAFTFTPPSMANFAVPTGTYGQMTQEERNALAQRLMAEAGFAADNPLSLTLLYNTSDAHRQIAETIAAMWRERLGVETAIENQPWQTFLDTRGTQKFDIARSGWCGDFNDPATFLDLMRAGSGYNDGKFSNAGVDALLDSARRVDDRRGLYAGIEQILAEEMPVIPLDHYSAVYMFSPRIRNWPVENAEQAWYSRNLYKTP
jgi:oligopeptide transport system substrate-binding protein